MREQVQDVGTQARVDGERARCAWLMSPTLHQLMGGHRAIGDRRHPMACEVTRQRARSSLYRLSHRSETMACRQHVTQFFTLHEGQSLTLPCATPWFLE